MGRLKRKKPSSQKKKKKQSVQAEAGEQAAQVAVTQAPSDTDKSVKKTKSFSTKKPATVPRQAPAKVRDNVFTKSIQFLREVKVELKKVTWPSRKQTVGSTAVVIILVTIIAFFLGAVDIGLSYLVKLVLQ